MMKPSVTGTGNLIELGEGCLTRWGGSSGEAEIRTRDRGRQHGPRFLLDLIPASQVEALRRIGEEGCWESGEGGSRGRKMVEPMVNKRLREAPGDFAPGTWR